MILSLDIETPGSVKRLADGQEAPIQRDFHPTRCMHHGIARRDLVTTVSITLIESIHARSQLQHGNPLLADRGLVGPDHCIPDWFPLDSDQRPDWLSFLGGLRPGSSMVFQMHRPSHRKALAAWLAKCTVMLGMNLPFDIMFMRSQPDLRPHLTPRILCIDLSHINYFHSEVRPERSLKDITALFGIDHYDPETSLKHHRYESPTDPKLHEYNARDSHNTVLAIAYLANRIRADHPTSDKCSDWCIRHYSDSIWLCTHMGETGIPFSPPVLLDLEADCLRRADAARLILQTQFDLKVDGTGSKASKLAFMNRIVDAVDALRPEGSPSILSDKRLTFSDKKREFGPSDNNRDVLALCLPLDHPLQPALDAYDTFSKCQKMASTYTWPLLRGPRNEDKADQHPHSAIIDGRAYPSWFPTPGRVKDDQGETGGTEQGRLTCLAKGTMVLSSEGDLPIEEVVARRLDVLTFNKWTGGMRFVTPRAWISNGVEQVFKVTMRGRNGFEEVLATATHRWLTRTGEFITTDQLKFGGWNRTSLRHVYRHTDHHGYPRIRSRGPGWDYCPFLHVLNCPNQPHVHHVDHNKANFARSNLIGMEILDHRRLHGALRMTFTDFMCENCNKSVHLPAKKRGAHRLRFCCRNCAYEWRRNNYYVCSVEPAGEAEVFCFTIPETENFILSNGLVSGNCKNPAAQTFPKEIKAAILPPAGRSLVWIDLSQIELRVAALVSGETSLLVAFQNGEDIHTNTAIDVYGRDALISKYPALAAEQNLKRWKDLSKPFEQLERQCGKHGNFTVLNLGGPPILQRTILKKGGISVPLKFCQDFIAAIPRIRPQLHIWQHSLIEQVKRDHVLHLPICGISRFFSGGPQTVAETYASTIVNCPIQTWAGLLMREYQINLMHALAPFNSFLPRPRQCINVYDATCIESPSHLVPTVLVVAQAQFKRLSAPGGLWFRLQEHYGHLCPITYDSRIVHSTPSRKESHVQA